MNEEKQVKILGFTGPSGCGKDTAARHLAEKYSDKYHYVKLCTTRPQRNEEDNGYEFLTPKDFLKLVMNGKMLNAQEFRGWHYGLSFHSLNPDKINVFPMSNIMIEQMLEEKRSDYLLKIIFINTNPKQRLQHILEREEAPDCFEVCRRFLSDEDDYEGNEELYRACDLHMINRYDNKFFNAVTKCAQICFDD